MLLLTENLTVLCCQVTGQTNHSPTLPIYSHFVVNRKKRCGTCVGCLRKDCGKCVFCLDMKMFGGQWRKKCCVRHICTKLSGILIHDHQLYLASYCNRSCYCVHRVNENVQNHPLGARVSTGLHTYIHVHVTTVLTL